MNFDEKEFFREATLRICGSLDVVEFLYGSYTYLRQYIPADAVVLTHHDFRHHRQMALAVADINGGRLLKQTIIQSAAAEAVMGDLGDLTLMIDRADAHPITRTWLRYDTEGLLTPESSLMTVKLVVSGQTVGAVNFINYSGRPFTPEQLRMVVILREPFAIALSNNVRYQELLELKDRLVDDNRYLKTELRRQYDQTIVGAEFGLKGVMEMVHQVAPLQSPVLLLGETGTGKEVIANAVHAWSPRRDGPFIKVNCGAIPENLMDSELFGHEKGAFTGALARKHGRFERADGGTIFLDEIGELRPDAQVRLLRVLQEHEIERIGGTEPVKVDIRVIAATHRDLTALVREGRFREDLYFRLKVFPVTIPPLRQRRGDIYALLQYFLQKKAREMGLHQIPAVDRQTVERLKNYDWPGNVRELENAVERALILGRGQQLIFSEAPAGPAASGLDPDTQLPGLDQIMAQHIRYGLQMAGGKVAGPGGAAELLKVNPSTLRKRMRKLGIPFGRQSGRPGDA